MTTEKLMKQKKKKFPNTHPITRLLRYRYTNGNPEMNIKKGKDSCKILISNVNRKLSQPHPVFSKAMLS